MGSLRAVGVEPSQPASLWNTQRVALAQVFNGLSIPVGVCGSHDVLSGTGLLWGVLVSDGWAPPHFKSMARILEDKERTLIFSFLWLVGRAPVGIQANKS